MSGHHPWSELTKHFTPEDREIVEAGSAEIVTDSDRREREAERPVRKAGVPPQGGASAPSVPDSSPRPASASWSAPSGDQPEKCGLSIDRTVSRDRRFRIGVRNESR